MSSAPLVHEPPRDSMPMSKVASLRQSALQRLNSIYPLEPNPKWLTHRKTIMTFMLLFGCTMALCLFVQDFNLIRIGYSIVATLLLISRVRYYIRKKWIFYFIDLCFVAEIALVATLWLVPWCSPKFLIGMYITLTGPVAGATFLLNIPLTFHHPEAFESFFMHGSPMWVVYALRWKTQFSLNVQPDIEAAASESIVSLIYTGFAYFYVWWALGYFVFLSLQPQLPDSIAGMETLMDGVLYSHLKTPEARLEEKRGRYGRFVMVTTVYVIAHGVLSLSGFAAAALAFKCFTAQVTWIVVVQIGGLVLGIRFYFTSAFPDDHKMPGVVVGFARMAVAWAVVGPTYFFACR